MGLRPEYREEHYFAQRKSKTQGNWETREKPVRTFGSIVLMCLAVVFGTALALLLIYKI